MKPYTVSKLRRLLLIAARTANVIGTVTHVWTRDPVAALTFDDGPHPEFTPRLLDILGKYEAHATFFIVGEAASRYPNLVHRIHQAGHAIGNHSWDHPSFPLISGSERRAQIRMCEKVIAPYAQRLFRPPYGHQDLASRIDALWLGYQVVTWNLVGFDWLDHDANWLADRLATRIRPGSIILLHDALYDAFDRRYVDRGPMLEAVDRLLTQQRGKFRFTTVTNLLQCGLPQRCQWFRAGNPDWLNGLQRQEGEAKRYQPGVRTT